jgi:hypothetical protein
MEQFTASAPESGCLKAIRGTNKANHGTDFRLQPDFEDK